MARVTKIKQSVNITWEKAFEEFLLWKRAQGSSETTIKDYVQKVSLFFRRFPVAWQQDLRISVLQFLSEDIKPATYNLRLVYLKVFFNWCVSQNYLTTNPVDDLKKRKAAHRIVEIPDDKLQELLSLPDKTTFAGLRDYAAILFSLDTGIRPKEAFALTIDAFDLKNRIVTIPAELAKTRASRVLPILHLTVTVIDRLIKSRHPEWCNTLPVLCSHNGIKMTRYAWGKRMSYYSKILGIRIRAYDLRHSFALIYLRNGGNAFSLQRILGHSDMGMTKRYVNLSDSDLKRMHVLASPLNRLVKGLQTSRVNKL